MTHARLQESPQSGKISSYESTLDQAGQHRATRLRRRLCVARRRAIARRAADSALGRRGGALPVRADCAAQVRAGARAPLAVVGPRRGGGHVSAIRRTGLSRRRGLPARTRYRAEPRLHHRRVRRDRLELPHALPGKLRRHAFARARERLPAAPGSAARLGVRPFLADRLRGYAPSFSSCCRTLASVDSKPARRARSCSTTCAGARSTNALLPSFAFAFTISPSRRLDSLLSRSRSTLGSTSSCSMSRASPMTATGEGRSGSGSRFSNLPMRASAAIAASVPGTSLTFGSALR